MIDSGVVEMAVWRAGGLVRRTLSLDLYVCMCVLIGSIGWGLGDWLIKFDIEEALYVGVIMSLD